MVLTEVYKIRSLHVTGNSPNNEMNTICQIHKRVYLVERMTSVTRNYYATITY